MCALEDNLNDSESGKDSVFLRIDHSLLDVREEDQKLFHEQISSFVPDEIFDAHAHWYDPAHLQKTIIENKHKKVGFNTMKSSLDLWMGPRNHDGLFFPFPIESLDCHKANGFLRRVIE